MKPDFEQRLRERMNEASLKEVMPDFDKEQEWRQLSGKLLTAKRKLPTRVWAYAAAIAVLAGVYLAQHVYFAADTPKAANKPLALQPAVPAPATAAGTNETGRGPDSPATAKPALTTASKQQRPKTSTVQKDIAAEVVYNYTECPIELRISQVMSCPNDKPKAISSTSTVEPDQAGKLKYKENDSVRSNCSLAVKEIEIVSIGTGERIVLNSSSATTAQEAFSYITGEKKGYVLAGMFQHDCEKRNHKHSLRLGNRNGNLVIE